VILEVFIVRFIYSLYVVLDPYCINFCAGHEVWFEINFFWQMEKGVQRLTWLDGITDSMDMNLSKLGDSERQGSLECRSPWGRKESHTT